MSQTTRSGVQSKLQYAMKQLEKKLHENEFADKWLTVVEQKTGIKRVYVAMGAIAIMLMYLIFGYAAQLLCNAIGFVYPAYRSVLALESPAPEDDRKWLVYWTSFAAFNVVEFFSDVLMSWVPFYWLAKCVLCLYMMAPMENNGSEILYNRVIRPFVLKHDVDIRSAYSDMKDSAKGFTNTMTNAAVSAATKSD